MDSLNIKASVLFLKSEFGPAMISTVHFIPNK